MVSIYTNWWKAYALQNTAPEDDGGDRSSDLQDGLPAHRPLYQQQLLVSAWELHPPSAWLDVVSSLLWWEQGHPQTGGSALVPSLSGPDRGVPGWNQLPLSRAFLHPEGVLRRHTPTSSQVRVIWTLKNSFCPWVFQGLRVTYKSDSSP